jgi:hypothetical protein
MSSYVSVGYLQPQQSRVSAGEIHLIAGGHTSADGRMPDWHYLSNVAVEWPLSVDLPGIKQDCQLPDDAEIGVVLSWRSDRTNLRSSAFTVPALDGENLLQAMIPGSTVGGTLTIEVALVLRRPGTEPSLLAPSRPGALLWGKSEQVVLEGSGGRFPTITADFAAEGIAGDGIGWWYLDVSGSDLQANCTSAITLYINSANPSIQDVLIEGSARDSQIVKFMMYDVYRQLMMVAIGHDEFDDRIDYDRGSLGDVLVTLLRLFFRGKDIGQLRRDFERAAPDIEAELLARTWRLQQ